MADLFNRSEGRGLNLQKIFWVQTEDSMPHLCSKISLYGTTANLQQHGSEYFSFYACKSRPSQKTPLYYIVLTTFKRTSGRRITRDSALKKMCIYTKKLGSNALTCICPWRTPKRSCTKATSCRSTLPILGWMEKLSKIHGKPYRTNR